MKILENSKLETAKDIVGKGWEHLCRKSKKATIVKTPRPFKGAWQHQSAEAKAQDYRLIDSAVKRYFHLNIIPTIFHKDPEVNGKKQKVAVEVPEIDGYEDYMPTFEQMQRDPQLQQRLIEISQLAYEMFNDPNSPRGLDPYGGEIMEDGIRAVVQHALQAASAFLPRAIQESLRGRIITGVKGVMRNILYSPNHPIKISDEQAKYFDSSETVANTRDLLITDSGMHNPSKDTIAPVRAVLKQLDLLMHGTLIALIKDVKPNTPDSEIPYSGNALDRKISEFVYHKIMKPQFIIDAEIQKKRAATGQRAHSASILVL